MHTFEGATDQKLKKKQNFCTFWSVFSAHAKWPGGKMSTPDGPNLG